MDYLEQNRKTWNERVRTRKVDIDAATAEEFLRPAAAIDAFGWLPRNLTGTKVLCLAAGGGRHGVLLAALGAKVTVFDLSEEMLEIDRRIARERNLEIETVRGSMEDLSALTSGAYDLVIQPVSTCYIEDLRKVYQEAARVLRPDGLYISHHKQPVTLQSEFDRASGRYYLSEPYYRSGPLSGAAEESLHRESGTVEFLHRWQDLLGGLCQSGFVIEDFAEPRHGNAKSAPGSFGNRSLYAAPFLAIKARKIVPSNRESGTSIIV